jgi:hypothetical protein
LITDAGAINGAGSGIRRAQLILPQYPRTRPIRNLTPIPERALGARGRPDAV